MCIYVYIYIYIYQGSQTVESFQKLQFLDTTASVPL